MQNQSFKNELTREGTNGARMPPNLQVIEQTPKPAFLLKTNKQTF